MNSSSYHHQHHLRENTLSSPSTSPTIPRSPPLNAQPPKTCPIHHHNVHRKSSLPHVHHPHLPCLRLTPIDLTLALGNSYPVTATTNKNTSNNSSASLSDIQVDSATNDQRTFTDDAPIPHPTAAQ